MQDNSHCWDSNSLITTLRISVIWSIYQCLNSDPIALQHSVLPTAGWNGHSLLKFGEQNVSNGRDGFSHKNENRKGII